ncbi:MAG: SusD/RagB family nutrient-binding outer membrane lipoprotein [Chitinophagaceae bacterium]|nr:SusD/RagB family nutrient-binding outer membrane lipoprotein [Chitinophagaceae bacterium]
MKVNKIKKYTVTYLLLGAVLITASCKKGFEDMNRAWNKDINATIPQLYNGIVSTMVLGWQEQATYHSWIYPVTQQAAITAASGYVMENAANEYWNNYYKALANARLIERKIEESADKGNYTNVLAMLRTLMAYKTLKLTEYFGDVPYSEAGRSSEGAAFYTAKYDKQSDIYVAAINDLKWAVDNFSTSPGQVDLGSHETFLKGNIATWVKFANSLRLRYAVRMYDKNQGTAAAQITEALSKPLLEATSDRSEDIGMWPGKITDLVLDGRKWSFSAGFFMRMGSTMWKQMSDNNNTDGSGIFDPRAKIFFEGNNAGGWVAYPQNPSGSVSDGGEPYNTRRDNDWSNKGAGLSYSPINYYFEKDERYIPELIITAAEVNLTKAEVYLRGLGVTKNVGTAKSEYEKGVTASVNFWTFIAMNSPVWVVNKPAGLPDGAAITALLENPKVEFDISNEADALLKIYTQLWIDGFRQPWDIWTLKRRTGNKTPMETDNAAFYNTNFGDINRFVYPGSEQDYNHANWLEATGGTDLRSNKIWLMP